MSSPPLFSVAFPQAGLSASGRQRPWSPAPPLSWAPGLDAVALGLWAAALGLVGLACLLVPQRIAQRPANQGVMTIHLSRDGALRVWNQPIATASLQGLLQRAERRSPGVRIRLVPAGDVPWGMVQALVERLEAPKRNLELHLP
ncbi:MAG: hypothetical protein ACK5N0_12405 [Synechococcaceae cyanobacterium]